MNDFFTINGEFENTLTIERSKFICYIKGISNEDEAKEFIGKIKKIHSLATHNCYAYIADEKGLIKKFSDDGEPQGTAGLPMLDVLVKKNLYKTVCVVTRYFGGIKLGTGGLTRAYSNSVLEAINISDVKLVSESKFFNLEFDYEQYSKFLRFFESFNGKIVDSQFLDNVLLKIAVKSQEFDKFIKELRDFYNGKIVPNNIELGFYLY